MWRPRSSLQRPPPNKLSPGKLSGLSLVIDCAMSRASACCNLLAPALSLRILVGEAATTWFRELADRLMQLQVVVGRRWLQLHLNAASKRGNEVVGGRHYNAAHEPD